MKKLLFGLVALIASFAAQAGVVSGSVTEDLTTLNFLSPCDDCSASGGPSIASATMALKNLTWTPAPDFSSYYATFDQVASFSYHSELLGTIIPSASATFSIEFHSLSDVNPLGQLLSFQIFFENPNPADQHGATRFVFGGHVPRWELYYGSAIPFDIGPLNANAWQVAGAASSVPEPSTPVLLLSALGLMGVLARRRKLTAS